jgi:glycosidase
MNKKILVIALILIVVAAIFFVLWQKKQKVKPVSEAPVVPALAEKTWLNEGAIYEVHPYYYPNHSFEEISADIPRIKELGTKTIYLMPVWERSMQRQETTLIYLINDYYKIDPVYGTNDDLKDLVKIAHENNMKILFDLVTCCTPPGSVVYNNNWTYSFTKAELDEKAKEMSWKLEYAILEGRNFVYAGKQKSPVEGGRDLYDFAGEIFGDKIMVRSFPIANWGPATDLAKSEVIKYFTGVAEYYVREYNIDGWRIDAPANNYNNKVFPGDHSSKNLLISAISAVKGIKPDAEFISEPGLPEGVSVGLEYINLPRIMPTIAEGKVTSQQFVNRLAQSVSTMGITPMFVAESHDQTRLNKSYPALNKNYLVLISTLPGVPFIQAGQEIGAKNDWFRSGNSQPLVNWSSGDYGLNDFYKKVLVIRNSNDALKYGDMKNVWKSGDNTIAYSRTYQNETVIIVINFGGKAAASVLNLPFKSGTMLSDELSNNKFTVSDPLDFKVSIPAYGARILTVKK